MANTHCADHEANMTRLAKLEERTATEIKSMKDMLQRLFVLQDESTVDRRNIMVKMTEVQSCVNKTGQRLGNIEEATDELKVMFRKRNVYADKVVKWGEESVDNLQKQIDALNDFGWFRETVTRWRDSLPRWIFEGVLLFLLLLALLHWGDLGTAIKGIIRK